MDEHNNGYHQDTEYPEAGDAFSGETYPELPLTQRRAKPDGAVDPAGEAGWYLEREREQRGETLDMAGNATGIHPYHIEAIEFGDMTRMPPRMEALEMIAAYAQYLGFDPQPLIEHYVKFLPRPAVAPRAHHPANPAPLSSAKILSFGKFARLPPISVRFPTMPGGAGGIVASVAGAILLFAGASWMMNPGPAAGPAMEQVADSGDAMPTATTTPEAEITVAEEPLADDSLASLAAGEEMAASSEETAALPAEDPDAMGAFIAEQVTDELPAPAKKKAAKPSADVASVDDVVQTPDGRAFGAKAGGTRLVLKAKAPVWVRVEDAQGNVVMTQMLMKGDTYHVPEREGLVVIARDGGLLSYVIDGQEKGILGPPGEILVGRSLDLKSFGVNG